MIHIFSTHSFGFCCCNRRAEQYNETADGIQEAYDGVPCKVVDSSKSDLETFAEICDFAEVVAAQKAEKLGPEGMRALKEQVRATGPATATLCE